MKEQLYNICISGIWVYEQSERQIGSISILRVIQELHRLRDSQEVKPKGLTMKIKDIDIQVNMID